MLQEPAGDTLRDVPSALKAQDTRRSLCRACCRWGAIEVGGATRPVHSAGDDYLSNRARAWRDRDRGPWARFFRHQIPSHGATRVCGGLFYEHSKTRRSNQGGAYSCSKHRPLGPPIPSSSSLPASVRLATALPIDAYRIVASASELQLLQKSP